MQTSLSHHHDLYCVLHPLKSGYLVYCADCYLVSIGESPQIAWNNWRLNKRFEQNFDRGDFSGPNFPEELSR